MKYAQTFYKMLTEKKGKEERDDKNAHILLSLKIFHFFPNLKYSTLLSKILKF